MSTVKRHFDIGETSWDGIEADLPLLELLRCEGNVLADDSRNEVVAVLW